MMMRCSLVVVILGITMLGCRADLPVHCLNTQIAGEWEFELGKNEYDNKQHCGHKVPDTNADHFTKEGFDLEVVKKMRVNLTEPNIAIDEKGNKGTWTMVYDEGFEMIIDGKKFFVFSKYVPKTPESLEKDDVEDYNSICDETLVGWYHNEDGTHWGCYHGKKVDQKPRFRSIRSQHKQEQLAPVDSSFMQVAPMSYDEDAPWEPDMSFIEEVNNDHRRTWRAGVHRAFVGNRMEHMMRLLGRRRHTKHKRFGNHHHRHRRHHRKHEKPSNDHGPSTLPESFDWRNHNGKNYDSAVKNQGNCGSCFAMATISVVEARIRIMTDLKHKPSISTQGVVSCSVYNQGCEGGYPYLVGKHAQDYGLVEEHCLPYTGTDEKCDLKCSHPKRYYATDYKYVGGYYGACNEQAMMEEIYNKGPIMVAFDAPSSLFYYNGGIYTGESPPSEGPKLKFLNKWEKTNHAVVAVGWGVDKKTGMKYWIIKNTWGQEWGEHGYFRIRRGTDECGIESMAVTLDIRMP